MRRLTPLLLLALAACGGEEAAPPPEKKPARAQVRQPPPAPQPAPRAPHAEGEGPREVLTRYYAHIEHGRFAQAWAMRSAGRAGSAEFARNFAAYERYRVTIGHPSEPVESGGWLFVEVPIQMFGRFKGGESFGSAGSITMRRAAGAPGATAREKEWHIYGG
jgi:hypothetical protein